MKKIRFLFALWVGKLARVAMRILGRNATYLPGKLATKICPDFMGQLKMPETVIVVTGTNGKTTVSNFIASVLAKNGYSVTNNSLGSNVQAAIATTLLADSDLIGKATKDIAVLEMDERSSILVLPYVKPDFLLCNNIMRDSIKRNAHTEFIRYIINRGLPSSTKLILNADDLNCVTLGPDNSDRTYFGIEADRPAVSAVPFVSDIVYCPKCGVKLKSEYLRYNHIGKQYCPDCGFGVAERDFLVTKIDREANTFTVRHDGIEEEYPLLNGNIINIYNFCGAIAALTRFGLSYDQIRNGFDKGEIVKSRYDKIETNGYKIIMQMAKGLNPIACTRAFSYAAECEGSDKGLVILIDDLNENTRNSENICWQYDCDYSFLADLSISQIVFAGPRCKDQYLRSLLAGVSADKIKMTSNILEGADLIDLSKSKDIYVLYDNYSIPEGYTNRDKLIKFASEGK